MNNADFEILGLIALSGLSTMLGMEKSEDSYKNIGMEEMRYKVTTKKNRR